MTYRIDGNSFNTIVVLIMGCGSSPGALTLS